MAFVLAAQTEGDFAGTRPGPCRSRQSQTTHASLRPVWRLKVFDSWKFLRTAPQAGQGSASVDGGLSCSAKPPHRRWKAAFPGRKAEKPVSLADSRRRRSGAFSGRNAAPALVGLRRSGSSLRLRPNPRPRGPDEPHRPSLRRSCPGRRAPTGATEAHASQWVGSIRCRSAPATTTGSSPPAEPGESDRYPAFRLSGHGCADRPLASTRSISTRTKCSASSTAAWN